MSRNGIVNSLVVALAACVPFSFAFAALRDAPPKGVDLSGRWKLSPELSEDPHAAVNVAREEMKEKEEGKSRKKNQRSGGGEMRPPQEKTRMPPGDQPPPPNPNRPPADDANEPDTEKQSTSMDDSDPLERLVTAPEEFAIEQDPGAFVLMTKDATDTCKTKQPGQVSVPGYGLSVRKCGWDKAGFVVEVAPKQGPLTTTRYEIDKESGRLFVTSELKGERIPKISVKRIYERVEPVD
jgi:hypothetical protein